MKSSSVSTGGLLAGTVIALWLVVSNLAAADTVVTFKQDLFEATPNGKQIPRVNVDAVEAACVAISLAQNILLSIPGGDGAPELPAQPVLLFPANAGVKLANESLLIESGVAYEPCADPNFGGPDNATPLLEHLKHFIALGGDVVVCPLCWNARGYNETADEGDPAGNEPYPDGNLVSADGNDCPKQACDVGSVVVGDGYSIGSAFKSADRVVDF